MRVLNNVYGVMLLINALPLIMSEGLCKVKENHINPAEQIGL